jgi:anti-sigma factor RsiW
MRCEQAIERIHQILDGDLMDAAQRQELESHLSNCDGCRKADAELRTIQQALSALPADELPEDALEQVWTRTTKARLKPAYHWSIAAAAAVLVLALLGLWQIGAPGVAEPTQAELDRAADEARMVLGLTAQALRKTEQAVFKSVLTDEVSPALKSVPIKWPGAAAGRRKGGNDV